MHPWVQPIPTKRMVDPIWTTTLAVMCYPPCFSGGLTPKGALVVFIFPERRVTSRGWTARPGVGSCPAGFLQLEAGVVSCD